MKLLLLFIIVVTMIILFFNDLIEYYDYGNINSKYKLCIVAGIHGNEPAASILLNKLIQEKYFKNIDENIFIRIIPNVNKFGITFNTRYQNNIKHPDINRNFIENSDDDGYKKIIELTKNMDLILDFHEGWGFHKINPTSLGSTITISPGKNMKELGKHIIRNLNNIIPKKEHKFILLKNTCRIKSSLGCYSTHNNTNYILVETTGQNNIQKLEIRHKQIYNVIITVISHFTPMK